MSFAVCGELIRVPCFLTELTMDFLPIITSPNALMHFHDCQGGSEEGEIGQNLQGASWHPPSA